MHLYEQHQLYQVQQVQAAAGNTWLLGTHGGYMHIIIIIMYHVCCHDVINSGCTLR